MKNKKLFAFGMLLTGLLWANFSQAQESINASGGNASGSGGSVSYSLGQVMYSTQTDNGGSVAQGVIQPSEIFSVGMNEMFMNPAIVAFPNPTIDDVNLTIKDYGQHHLLYMLFDVQGRLLSSGEITAENTQLHLSNLPNSMYFLQVMSTNNTFSKSFKIIKN